MTRRSRYDDPFDWYVDNMYLGQDGFHSQTGENLGPCWLVPSSPNADGYSIMRVNNKEHKLHRLVNSWLNEPFPAKLDIDHLCGNRPCSRPSHMEAVLHAENVRRGRLSEANRKRHRKT